MLDAGITFVNVSAKSGYLLPSGKDRSSLRKKLFRVGLFLFKSRTEMPIYVEERDGLPDADTSVGKRNGCIAMQNTG